ncbi:MAG: hypothetical protein KAR40_10595 [Candidatus Sabulitectum sp.]|nr:hypothetical protein [Candidatus Sabulitectum sp.]
MTIMRILGVLTIATALFVGCDDATGPGGALPPITQVDSVKVDYKGENNAVFYCLSTKNKISIPHDVWDIAVDGNLNLVSNSGDYGIGVAVFPTNLTDFDLDFSTYADSAFDGSTNLSFTDNDPFEGWMIYDSVSHDITYSNEVFIIQTEDRSFYKVQFTRATMITGVSITAKIDALNGTGAAEAIFTKDSDYDRGYIDLGSEAVVAFAPRTTEWDLKFARGNQLIDVGGGNYMVHGMSAISINTTDNIKAYILEETNFEDVTSIESTSFSGEVNVIGNKWYTFSGQPDMIFTCDNDVSVIKTDAGTYKLQMSTFYGGADGDEFFSSIFEFKEME